jgi:hypothetical protein
MQEKTLGIEVIPVYGIISASGGQWTVEYHVTKNTTGLSTHSITGYGDFPKERYPDIPVIDYTTAQPGMIAKSLGLPGTVRPNETEPYYSGTLETFLNAIRDIGISVI